MKSNSSERFGGVTKAEIIFICQLLAAFSVLITALLNLSLSSRDKELWATLAGAAFTYLIPCPKKSKHKVHIDQQISSVKDDEFAAMDNVSVQRIDDGDDIEHSCGVH